MKKYLKKLFFLLLCWVFGMKITYDYGRNIFFFAKDIFMPGSKPNMGEETPFAENDLTTDQYRYTRTQKLVRKNKNLRLWGVTNAWAKAVKAIFNEIRKKDWAETIDTEILFINSLDDRVVSSNHILEMSKKLKNAEIINFNNCEHEIFMEQDKFQKNIMEEIDSFCSNYYLR